MKKSELYLIGVVFLIAQGWAASVLGADPVLHAESGRAFGYSSIFNVISNPSAPDTDGDGIPDWWESLYFGGITNCLATGHADSDVHSNVEEYIAGTNPTNGASFLSITNCASMPSGFFIQWQPSVSDREYSVHRTNDLLGAFTSLVSGIEFPQNSYTDTVHGAEDSGFYKVKAKLK